jgi:hypothetical protein
LNDVNPFTVTFNVVTRNPELGKSTRGERHVNESKLLRYASVMAKEPKMHCAEIVDDKLPKFNP